MIKPRTCTCCGESKPTTAFTHNGPRGTYTPTCRDCGVWLMLFRQVFGKARYMDRVREHQKTYDYEKRMRIKSQPANDLFEIWGIRRVA